LLAGGANPSKINFEGLTALHISIQKMNPDASEFLINSKTDLDLQTIANKETPLHLATANSCF